ncbi:PPE domain-containing protein [Nocardia sp. NPDC049190]|uniref:PPE domain-containing protein n=1 Tax=Nocardia sp. NPDC049190 TaxID=3155650 RepID=UPI003409546A
MAEAHEAGFTGRIWEAVPPDKLVRDLETGAGAAPMAHAASAFARLAAGLAEAAVEYEVIRAELGRVWTSDHNEGNIGRLAELGTWFVDAAAAAATNAAKAQAQAAAYEIARIAMPSGSALAALEMLKDALLQGNTLGSPLQAVSAELEDETDVARAHAARVMQEYEKATTALAEPWTQPEPPRLTSDIALTAETAAAEQPSAGSLSPPLGSSLARIIPPGAFPRAKVAYRAQAIVRTATEPVVVETTTPVTVAPAPITSLPPLAPLTAAANAQDEEHTGHLGAGAAAAADDPDRIGLDAGYHTAPAVVGGQSAPRARRIDPPEVST